MKNLVRAVSAIGLTLSSSACNPFPRAPGQIPMVTSDPPIPCIGQIVRLSGERFALGKVQVRVERPPNWGPVELGEVDVDTFGKWSLSFKLESDLVSSTENSPSGELASRYLRIQAAYDHGAVLQGIPVGQ